MGAKDVYEKLQREKNLSDSKSKRVYAQLMQSKIMDEYNSLVQHNSDFFNKTKSRFYDEDENYIDKYRPDSEDWKNTAVSLSSSAREKSNKIRSLLNEYGNYYDADFVTNITNSLNEHDKYSSDIASQAISQYDFFSKFKTEYDYNAYLMNNTSGYESDNVTTRQNAYAANSARIKSIDDEIANMPESEKYTKKAVSAGRGAVAYQNVPTDAHQKLLDEKQKLEAENRKYEHNFKSTDENLLQYRGNEDYATDSQIRDGFLAPSPETIKLYKSDVGGEYFGKDNEFRYNDGTHATGVGTDSKGNKVAYNIDDLTIEDPLGTYLKAHSAAGSAGVIGDWSVNKSENEIIYNYEQLMIKGSNSNWELLNDDELGLYYYFLNNNMKEEALSYLDGMTTELNRRANNEMIDYLENDAKPLEMVFYNIASVPANVFGGAMSFLSDAATMAMGKDINPYDGAHSLSNFAQNVRGATANDINEWTNNAEFLNVSYGDAYQSVMSGMDSILGSVTIGKGYSALMGMGAASSKAKELYEKGASNTEIAFGGLLAGAAEMVFESLSVGYFLDNFINSPVTWKNIIPKILAQGGVELSEEIATEISNTVTDAMVMGSQSDWEQTINKYKDLGYSDSEAMTKALWDIGGNVLEAGISGFISGAFMGGGGSIINLAQNTKAENTAIKKAGTDIVSNENLKALFDTIENLPDTPNNAKIKAAANEIKGIDVSKLSEKELSALSKKVGKLYSSVQTVQGNMIYTSGRDTITNIIAEKLNEKGITDELKVKKATDAIIKSVYGGKKLSASESKLLDEVGGNDIASYLLNNKKDILAKTNIAHSQRLGQAIETASLTKDKNANVRTIDTDNYTFSDNGETYVKGTDEVVTVTGVNSIKDGKMKVNLSNGKTADLSELDLGSEDQAIIYEGILGMDIDAASAQAIVKAFDFNGNNNGLSAKSYILGMQDAVRYGKIGGKAFIDSGVFTSMLSEGQRKMGYRIGEITAENAAKKDAKRVNTSIKLNKNGNIKAGNVSYEGISEKDLNIQQKTTVKILETLFGGRGVNIVFFQSPVNEKGVHTGESGSFNAKTNTIRLDINAGEQGKDTILFTAAHELTHFIRLWSPEKFKTFADFLVDNYAKHGVDIDTLVERQIQKAKNNGRTIDYDEAYEEVIADSCESFLRDSKLLEKLIDLAKKDMTLFEKTQLYISNLLADIRKYYNDIEPDSPEGKIVLKWKDCIEELHALWEEAALSALGNSQKAGGRIQKNTTYEGGVKYDDRPFAEQVDDVLGGKFERGNAVYVGILPKILQDVGLNGKLPMLTTASHIKNANKPKNTKKHHHGLTDKQIKNIPEKIANPVMIMDSLDGTKNSIVVVTDMLDVDKSPIVVSIKADGKGMYNNVEIYSNFLTGYYGRDGFANFIENNVSADTFLYINKEKATALSTESSTSWLEQLESYDFDTIIRKTRANVKGVSKKSQEKRSDRDTLGNTLTEAQQTYFAESKVRDESGNLKVMYHGTPNATFTKFRSGSYFTEHKWYADNYQNQGASGLSYKKTADNPDTYAVYLDIKKPFDTRNKKERDIWYKEFYLARRTSTPLMESGLPDWLDGEDLQEFLEEKGYDYDGLILDEGATGGYGEEVISRGLSYVIFNPEQVKSVDNKNPTKDADIRFSDRDERYRELQTEYNQLEKEAEALKQSAEHLNFLDSISLLQGDELDKAVKDYGEWTRKSGLYDISKRMSEIIGEQKDIRAALDNEKELSRDAYMKSIENLTEKEKMDFVNKAVERYGTTKNIRLASYLMLNGEMLDFSEGQRERVQDHREISEILDMPDSAEYSDGLIAFMNMGNIRLQTYGIDISQAPNQAQKSALRDIITQIMRNENGFTVDFSKANGYSAGSVDYPRGTATSKILSDIDSYFDTGVVPVYKSSVSEFLYSDRDSAGNELSKEQIEFFKDSKVRDENGNLLKVYHGTPNKFTVFKPRTAQGWGTGIYFTDNKSETIEYGENVVEAYLNITNPFNADTMSYSDIGAENTKAYRDYDMQVWKKRFDEYDTYEEYKEDGMGVDMYEIYTEEVEVFNKILRELGYDGIIANHSNNIDGLEIVAFYENQPKLTSNTNPTSNPDIRYSDRDSSGNTLTKEQVEFFKNSKVRDAKGNLLVMYHGTSKGGHTVFDTYGSNYGLFGTGSYFTDNRDIAESYTKKGKGNNPQVYDAYLNITTPIDMDAQADVSKWQKQFPDADFSNCTTNEECYRAMEEWLEDEMLPKWEAAEIAIDGLQEMGYDGVTHIGGGRVNTDGARHRVYIAFEPEQIKDVDNKNPTSDPDIRYSERVTDKETLDYLNKQIEKGEYIKVYRSFQVIDGGLYAPMNAVDRDENGKNKRLGYRSEYGVWEKSTESPEIAQRYMDTHPNEPYAKFDLDGIDNKTNAVAYNPYLHASNLVLNDQFAAAYRRNLITVECYVPLSEANGAYKAQYAKDATGWVDWKAGGVAGKLLKLKPEHTRKLFVSRYMLPVRQVPDSEVAAMYKEYLDGTDIAVPWNVVTPNLRKELEKVGVAISYKDVKAGSKTISFNDVFSDDVKFQDRDSKTADDIAKINQQLAKENIKLMEDVKNLKELVKLQGKETHGKILKKSTVELVAKRLMAYSSAKGEVSELVGYLTDVYSYIMQGEDVSWEGIQEKSQAAVNWLIQNEYHKPVRDELANEILSNLRGKRVSLGEKQKAEVAYVYGSYNDFRKKNMGRVIFTDSGIPLDVAWQELAEMYPMYFDKDVSDGDQPIMLMEIIDGLQNTYEADEFYGYYNDMIAQDLMTKVYEGYWDVSALHTVADAKQKEINLLRAKHIGRMDELRQSHKESEEKLRKEHKEQIAQLRTQYREREEAKIQKVAQYYQKSRKEAVDRVKETREKRDAITKLQSLVLDTAKWVSYPKKDDVKCPDIIRAPYAEFLSSIDLSSKRLLNGGEPTKNDLRVASAMDSLAKAIEKKLGTQSPDTETEMVLDTGYLDLPVHFVENLKELAEDLKNRMDIDGHIVNSMTSDEIKALTKFIKTLNHSIKEMSTLYANMRFAKVEQLGNDTMVSLKDLGEIEKTNKIANFVTWDNALPYYTFKRFGVAGESVFEELMDAQDKLAYLADEIFKFKEKTWADKESSEWSKDTHTIELPSGRKVTLTSADAMSIYCLARREQGKQHLLGGGVRVLGIEKNGKKANDSRSLLNEQDILAIASSLTERQKQVAEAIQEYMSTVCSEWGNEISMKRFLTREFTEKFYFPIESNDENLDTKDPKAQQSDLYRLLNISATKPLTKGANNEVIIRNVFDVFANHSSDMARLNAYGMALLDYMKWINYREKTVNDDGQISVSGVRKSMEKAYGPEAKKYVLGLIKDINGRYNDNGDNKLLMKMMRGAKTAMVGANLRVAVLQFTAYPRAAMVLSNKSLALGLTKIPQIEKAKKYCGIALWKSFGFYDTNISKSVEEQIKGTTNIRQKLIELSLKGAEWGDAITWGCLWNACEYEVAKTKKYKVGSEEFNQAVGKKLREVVYASQVVDSTLTRSQMMRSKSGLTQSASAFMSEPTLSANILMDAAFQFNLEKRRTGSVKLAWKKTGKYVGKAVAVYSIGQLFAALVEGLMDAYRDDDDEEFKDKFGEAFKENAISDLNPFNKIPIITDISEILLSLAGIGYYSSNSLYSTATDEFKNAFETWLKVINGEDGKTVYAGIYSTTKLLSYITGVSGSGLMREAVTLWNNTAGAYDPYLKVRTYETSATDRGIAEYKFDKGDTASVKTTVSKMVADKVKSGKTEKEAKSAVRSSFTSAYKPEYMAAVKAKDYDEMNRIRKFLYATGLYGTLSELDETLKKWRTAE